MEQFGLEGTLKSHLVQCTAHTTLAMNTRIAAAGRWPGAENGTPSWRHGQRLEWVFLQCQRQGGTEGSPGTVYWCQGNGAGGGPSSVGSTPSARQSVGLMASHPKQPLLPLQLLQSHVFCPSPQRRAVRHFGLGPLGFQASLEPEGLDSANCEGFLYF